MKVLRFFLSSFILISAFFNANLSYSHETISSTKNEKYEIVKDDTLSTLLFKLGHKKNLYGRHGAIEKTLEINPGLKYDSILYPGQKINIPSGPFINISKRQVAVAEEVKDVLKQEKEVPIADNDGKVSSVQNSPLEIISPDEYKNILSFMLTNRSSLVMGFQASNSTKGTLVSKQSPGLDLAWRQVWDKKLETFLELEYFKSTIADDLNRKSIQSNSNGLIRFGIGIDYKFHSRFSIGGGLGHDEQLFYRALNSSTYKVDKFAINSPEINVRSILIKAQHAKLDLMLGYRAFLPTENEVYSTKLGSGFDSELRLINDHPSFSLIGKVFFSTRKISISEVDYTGEELGLGVGLSKSWGN